MGHREADPAHVLRRRTMRRLLVIVLGGYLLALALNRSQVVVAGPSMEPSLWEGDRLLTIPAAPWLLREGRIVVVRDPTRADHLVVKRIATADAEGVTVLGDAPERSTDSRSWGPLPPAAIRRVAVARWPDVCTPLTRQARHGHARHATDTPGTPRTRRPRH